MQRSGNGRAARRAARSYTPVLDGEIVCPDAEGRSLFNPLLFRRCRPVFAAFDVVWLNGKDARGLPLIERTARLRSLLPVESPYVLHVDYLSEKGGQLFAAACENDLEGVVGKWAQGSYQSNGRSTSWVKVKNPNYSQAEGRRSSSSIGRGRSAHGRQS